MTALQKTALSENTRSRLQKIYSRAAAASGPFGAVRCCGGLKRRRCVTKRQASCWPCPDNQGRDAADLLHAQFEVARRTASTESARKMVKEYETLYKRVEGLRK